MMPWRKTRLSRRAMLGSAPRLNPAVQWRELDSGLIMAVYVRGGPKPLQWLRKLFAMPEIGELLLDAVGTRVIRQIDGRRTVADLTAYVAREFKLSRKEAEVALLKYLDMLARRGFVGFEVHTLDKVS